MRRDERDPNDAPTDQPRSRTDRLEGDSAGRSPINPGWRSGRTTGRNQRAGRSIPTSSQEFIQWLQWGGWRFVLATLAVVAIIGFLIVLTSRPSDSPDALPAATSLPANANIPLNTPLPTVTPAPAIPTAAPAQSGARFRVTGTGSDGLFLRPAPSTDGQPLKTLPEGSEVTIVGEDKVQADRTWKHIRDTDGTEGWAAADFLKPVGP